MSERLILSQAWYRPELCDSCPELEQVTENAPGIRGSIAWCRRIEDEKPCLKKGKE